MNFDEQIARQYLEHIGYSRIAYEPDGKIPPDFLVENSVAIEVRRLNQQTEGKNGPIGLEEESIPFINGIERLLDQIDAHQSYSWFVSVYFHRPIPRIRDVRNAILQTCDEVSKLSASPGQSFVRSISNSISLVFTRRSTDAENPFTLGGISDADAGGFVHDLLSKNIDHCILDKTKKVLKFKERYNQWWLILVDHISYCTSKIELNEMKKTREKDGFWKKIIIVSAIDPKNSFEL